MRKLIALLRKLATGGLVLGETQRFLLLSIIYVARAIKEMIAIAREITD